MRFLLPIGGVVDGRFGIITSPQHAFAGVPLGIRQGMEWAADMGCLDGPEYVKRFNEDVVIPWLGDMWQFRDTCLFIAGRDVVGNAQETIKAFDWLQRRFMFWPLAFCAQDGQEDLELPSSDWKTLFIGGSTAWKTSQACVLVIKRAQELGKCIHVGRVNWFKRYAFFRRLKGSEYFTCDGTRPRFDGAQRTVEAWAGYQAQLAFHSDVPGGDSFG